MKSGRKHRDSGWQRRSHGNDTSSAFGDSISEEKMSRAVRRRILDTGLGRDSRGARTIIQWDLNPLSRAAEKVNLSPSKLL